MKRLIRFWLFSSLCLLSLIAASGAYAQSGSNFLPVKLPRGIELQVPQGWWLLGADHNRAIQTSIEAAMDLSGIGLPPGSETNLIAANSMPKSTYAAVRVDSTVPPSLTPSQFAMITAADLSELQTEIHQNVQKLLPLQGHTLIRFFGTSIERISGHPAIVTEYRRSGLKGPVFVQVNQVFTARQEIRINLSYREAEVALWKPVVAKIRNSIVVR